MPTEEELAAALAERERCAAIVRRSRFDEHADIMLREIENGDEETPRSGSIVWDFRAAPAAPEVPVYCYCRGQCTTSRDCPCYGTPKFYGPERAEIRAECEPGGLRC